MSENSRFNLVSTITSSTMEESSFYKAFPGDNGSNLHEMYSLRSLYNPEKFIEELKELNFVLAGGTNLKMVPDKPAIFVLGYDSGQAISVTYTTVSPENELQDSEEDFDTDKLTPVTRSAKDSKKYKKDAKSYLYTVYASVSSSSLNKLTNLLHKCKRPKNSSTGFYEMIIQQYFIVKANQTISNTEYYRHTDSFPYLKDYLYPSINLNKLMDMYLESSESILILLSPPGTGKTCIAKRLMQRYCTFHNMDSVVVYVKDPNVLRNTQFWSIMAEIEPDLLILDDLDDELIPRRENEDKDIVGQLLSFSDGIFDIATKIVITTNLTDSAIDEALLRPGRCFDAITVPELTYAEAKEIWTTHMNNSASSFVEIFGVPNSSKISQALLTSEDTRINKGSSSEYLSDPSISVRYTVNKSKPKIGFVK